MFRSMMKYYMFIIKLSANVINLLGGSAYSKVL